MTVFDKLRKLIDEAEALTNHKTKAREAFKSSLSALNDQVNKVIDARKAPGGLGIKALQLSNLKNVQWDNLPSLSDLESTDPGRAVVIGMALSVQNITTKDELFEFLSKHPTAAADYIESPFKL